MRICSNLIEINKTLENDKKYEQFITDSLNSYINARRNLCLDTYDNFIFNNSRYEHCILGYFIYCTELYEPNTYKFITLDSYIYDYYDYLIINQINEQDFIKHFEKADYLNRRPDMIFIHNDTIYHVEIDEDSHRNYNMQDEINREIEIKNNIESIYPNYNYKLLRFNIYIKYNTNYERMIFSKIFIDFFVNNL